MIDMSNNYFLKKSFLKKMFIFKNSIYTLTKKTQTADSVTDSQTEPTAAVSGLCMNNYYDICMSFQHN